MSNIVKQMSHKQQIKSVEQSIAIIAQQLDNVTNNLFRASVRFEALHKLVMDKLGVTEEEFNTKLKETFDEFMAQAQKNVDEMVANQVVSQEDNSQEITLEQVE